MSNRDSKKDPILAQKLEGKIEGWLAMEEEKDDYDIDQDFDIPTKLNLLHYSCILMAVGLAGCSIAAMIYSWTK